MNWLSRQWQRIPDKGRDYLIRVATWLLLIAIGWIAHRLTGVQIERVPFPVYVDRVEREVVTIPTPGSEASELATGWVPDPDAVKSVIEQQPFKVFSDTPAGKTAEELPDHVYLWKCYEQIFARPPPSKNQNPVGSCVAFGTNNAIERTMAFDIAILKRPYQFKHICEEVTYAGSRVEIGGGRIGGDGSVGAWAAQFVQKYGIVERAKVLDGRYDLTSYDPNRCRDWGRRGVPDDLEPLAREHPVKEITLVKSWAEAKKALAQGYGIAVCSNQGFVMQRDTRGICRPSGTWAHCMCLDGYHREADGKEFGHIENSWGPNAHTGPVGWGNPPPSGFWTDSATIDRMLRQGDSWAFSTVKGWPARKVIWPAALPAEVARYSDRAGAREPKRPLSIFQSEFALAP